MARPKKWRNVCSMPTINRFGPLGGGNKNGHIVMTVDEYETIRLIDNEGMKQEECAKLMNVARTTVQGIYENARKKIADSIVNARVLMIEGGEYTLCDSRGGHCGVCRRQHKGG